MHTCKIIHTKTSFAPECHPHKKILSDTKLSHSSLIHQHLPHMSSFTSKLYSNKNTGKKSPFSFSSVSLGLHLVLWLQTNQALTHNRYISLHTTTHVAYYFFYFYVICKYYHTNKYGCVLEYSYSSQEFNTHKDGVVLGTIIQYCQYEVTLR